MQGTNRYGAIELMQQTELSKTEGPFDLLQLHNSIRVVNRGLKNRNYWACKALCEDSRIYRGRDVPLYGMHITEKRCTNIVLNRSIANHFPYYVAETCRLHFTKPCVLTEATYLTSSKIQCAIKECKVFFAGTNSVVSITRRGGVWLASAGNTTISTIRQKLVAISTTTCSGKQRSRNQV